MAEPGTKKSPISPDMNRSMFRDDRSLAEHFQRPALMLSVLSALTLAVYWVSVSFQFVWDDTFQIIDNPLIRSWQNLPQVFLSDLWFHVQRSQLYYRPLFTVWSMLNYWLFRLDPRGWHLAAILLHIGVVWAVYLLARKLRMEYWTAALGAAIFALHPIHIEAVSWISAASDSMVTLFYVTAFAAYIAQGEAEDRRKRIRFRILGLFLLACALLTKEMGVTFFVVAGVYTVLFSKSSALTQRVVEAIKGTWPFALITLGYFVLRKAALHALVVVPPDHHTTTQLVMTLPYVIAFYVRQLLFPKGLTGLYYTPYLKESDWLTCAAALAVLVALAALIWYWKKQKHDKLPVFLGLWSLLTLAPALYLPNFTNGDFVRDRYIYLPSVGFILLAAEAIRLLPGVAAFGRRTVQTVVVVLVLAGLCLGCEQQIYWDNELSLFQRGHDLYPKSTYASVGLARMLERANANDRALKILKQAIAENPGNLRAYVLLAEAYSRAGDNTAARQTLNTALAGGLPTTGELDQADLAGLLGRVGEYDQAIKICNGLLARAPDLLSALYNCGNIQLKLGHANEAVQLLSKAVTVAPGQSDPLYWLGRAYLQAGRVQEAKQALLRAINLNNAVPEYHEWMQRAEQASGNAGSHKEAVTP
ncbi:MAG TPA: tetratricopeptide repeat protein [Candidatus Angelobacter sp.]|nr:tetratricopeptide repeat protein [Candidatus Angelobacter sp.]